MTADKILILELTIGRVSLITLVDLKSAIGFLAPVKTILWSPSTQKSDDRSEIV